jgi:hypothetical protein
VVAVGGDAQKGPAAGGDENADGRQEEEKPSKR